MEKDDFGTRLEKAFRARGHDNLRAFAQAIGVPYTSLHSRVVAGTPPREERLKAISDALGVPPIIWRMETESQFDAALAAAVGDPTAPDLDTSDEAIHPKRALHPRTPTGVVRSYKIENEVLAGGVVRGIISSRGEGVDPRTEKLGKAIKNAHLHRGAATDERFVELASVGDRVPVELAAPLEVKVEGETMLHLPAGWFLIVDVGAKPQPNELEIVLVEKASERSKKPDGEGGLAELRRFVIGPHGVRLLFQLDSDKAVTEDDGWRIVGVVVDHRPPPRQR